MSGDQQSLRTCCPQTNWATSRELPYIQVLRPLNQQCLPEASDAQLFNSKEVLCIVCARSTSNASLQPATPRSSALAYNVCMPAEQERATTAVLQRLSSRAHQQGLPAAGGAGEPAVPRGVRVRGPQCSSSTAHVDAHAARRAPWRAWQVHRTRRIAPARLVVTPRRSFHSTVVSCN